MRIIAATGLAAVTALVMAAPASAVRVGGETSSFGVQCAGLVTCGPFAASDFPHGPFSNTSAGASVPGLITTGVINTTATATGATASTANVNATLSTISTLTATAVSSQCTVSSGGVSGTTSIVGGQITVVGLLSPITLATAPAPNTTVTVVDPAIASIVLNRQTTAADGTLTVDAIFITLVNGQTITISSSSCSPTTLVVPMASGKGLLIGGGLLVLLILGYAYKRRPFLSGHTA